MLLTTIVIALGDNHTSPGLEHGGVSSSPGLEYGSVDSSPDLDVRGLPLPPLLRSYSRMPTGMSCRPSWLMNHTD